VVLVSFDGFRYDYQDLFETPNLDRLAEAGIRADGLIPSYPVKTFPNHYSVATGMYPARHGLVGNRFWDPERGEEYSLSDRTTVEDGSWYGGEPIWVTAERQGMVTASYFFVGTEAPVAGIQPTWWYAFDENVPYGDRVDQVLEWLSRPAEARPHLVTLYFEGTDSKGHEVSTDSWEMREAVAAVDAQLGRLLDGVDALPHGDRVHVVVVSDHGMAPFFASQTYHVPDLVDIGDGVRFEGAGPHMVVRAEGGGAHDDGRLEALREALAEAVTPCGAPPPGRPPRPAVRGAMTPPRPPR
jgi:predicted AlkP superfamily pyrophosphatase or phosphodiesterase